MLGPTMGLAHQQQLQRVALGGPKSSQAPAQRRTLLHAPRACSERLAPAGCTPQQACHATEERAALGRANDSNTATASTSHQQRGGESSDLGASSSPSCHPGLHVGPTTVSALTLATAAALALCLLSPPSAHSTEALSGSSLSAFKDFLDYVESLGPAGPVVFVVTVMLFEMVPLFPTQPLSIASGLLFGPVKGTIAVLVGVSAAATNAFLISRGVGRKLAERVIVMEMSEDHGVVAKKLAQVQHTIRSGGFWKQLTAIVLLRLTPVVPFSASNYVLGLTPVLLPAYLGGTVIGMSAWSLVYASLGAASRQLLDGGMDVGTLFADLASKASSYSSTALSVSLGAGVVAGAGYAVSRLVSKPGSELPPEEPEALTGEASADEELQQQQQKEMEPSLQRSK